MTNLKLAAVAALGLGTVFGASAASAANLPIFTVQTSTSGDWVQGAADYFNLAAGVWRDSLASYAWLGSGSQTVTSYLEQQGSAGWTTVDTLTTSLTATSYPSFSVSTDTNSVTLGAGTYRYEIVSALNGTLIVAGAASSTAAAVPGPIAGAGLPVLAAMGVLGFFRRRKQNAA